MAAAAAAPAPSRPHKRGGSEIESPLPVCKGVRGRGRTSTDRYPVQFLLTPQKNTTGETGTPVTLARKAVFGKNCPVTIQGSV